MRRREFIKVIAGSAAAWPLAAFAQQSERVRRIGVLTGGGLDADDLDLQARIGAFEDGLKQLGWTNGQNVRVDIRAGAGDADRLRIYAGELVALAPDVILTTGAAAVAPMLKATRKCRSSLRTLSIRWAPASSIA
jgi:putative tryptophan/tyrosine transport system substrate-binding protein